ncbi:pyridoxamine 5'-phosphate oxidase family protein [Bythopirellula polymerisocia]|uniref:Pyridoxamine 5'-phosphate oxidase n=1 Tax=Bythopirellula polymerisocia TaxID=2528003 RepID=A0A5C6D0R0_9BACT|nr:pyridoxamine 5'-phosphate oxidase family protein [Bythopirellula polymerisocia]TWU29414.1 Pyridoxamine 5'-phosphate oxidase [Bythopirellula polymerisocia]
MTTIPSDIAFTPAVKAVQASKGSRAAYHRMERSRGWQTQVTPDLAEFLSNLDMFYFGTATADGQPYIQYRGGPAGFLKSIGPGTLAFADFGGNQQYLSVGNLSENSKAFLFLMDYENQRRVKVWGRARVVEGDDQLNSELSDPSYPAAVERAIVFAIEAWDVNCPQHIHRRIPESKVQFEIERLMREIDDLKARLGDVA